MKQQQGRFSFVHKFATALFLALVLFSLSTGLFLNENRADAHPTAIPSTNYASIAEKWQQQIARDSKYVHVQNYVATIDPTISKYLPANEVDFVQKAVKIYNALPLSSKLNQQASAKQQMGTKETNIQPRQLCAPYEQTYYYWWGIEVVLNHCAVTDLEAGGAVAAGVLGLLAAPVGVIVGAEVATIAWADGQCPNGGAYLDILPGGVVYGRPLC